MGVVWSTIFTHVMLISEKFLFTGVDNQAIRHKTHVDYPAEGSACC
jgi:hypothetical protein